MDNYKNKNIDDYITNYGKQFINEHQELFEKWISYKQELKKCNEKNASIDAANTIDLQNIMNIDYIHFS